MNSSTLKSSLGFLLKDTFLFGVANAINASMMLLLFPLLARNLTVEHYGYIDFILSLIIAMGILVVFGQDSAIGRFFYDKDSELHRKNVISLSLTIQLATTALCLFVLVSLYFTGVNLFPFSASDSVALLALIQIPLTMLQSSILNILKWSLARRQFLIISLGSSCSLALLNCLLAWQDAVTIESVLWAFLLSRLVFVSVGIAFISKWFINIKNIDYSMANPLLKFAVPYGIICSVGVFYPVVEKIVIGLNISQNELGIYAAAFKVASLFNLPILAFQTAWGPFYMRSYKDPVLKAHFSLIIRLYIYVMSFGLILMLLLSKFIVVLLAGEDYVAGADYVPFISAYLVIQSVFAIITIGIDLGKRTHLRIYGYLAYASVGLLGMLVLTDVLGVYGVIFSTFAGILLRGIMEYYFAQKSYSLHWNTGFILTMFFFLLGIGVIGNFIQGSIILALVIVTCLLGKEAMSFTNNIRKEPLR